MSTKLMLLAGALALATAEAATPQEPLHPTTRRGAGADVRTRRVRLDTGVELEIVQAGPQDGTPVLFLHGYTDSWYSFAPVLDRLPRGVHAIVPSQRGHGESERPPCCYGFPELAADAVAILDALDIPRAAVVGHSMGSFVAQRVAIEYPDRVSHLVLVGSGYTYRTEALLSLLTDVVSPLGDTVPPELIEEFQLSTTARPLPAAFLAAVIAESGKVPARVWRDALSQQLASDASDALGSITAPTLLVSGALDDFFPPSGARELARRIGGAREMVYGQTGHAVHWEEPDRFVQDLKAFLEPSPTASGNDPADAQRSRPPRRRGARRRLSSPSWRVGIGLESEEVARGAARAHRIPRERR